jgi:uncharacterized protein DUF4326
MTRPDMNSDEQAVMTRRPGRVQLRRTPGWRKPDGAVVVARPSRWGNPHAFRVPTPEERARVVDLYRVDLEAGRLPFTEDDVRRELAGRDLCCWCPLDHPCHADVLLAVANDR